MVTLAASPLVIFGAGPVPRLGIAGAAWAVVAYNVAMAAVLLRAVWASGSPVRPGFRGLVPRWREASVQGRGAMVQPLLATLTRLLVAGALGPGAGGLRLGDRLPVRPDGLRPRALRDGDGGGHAPRAGFSAGGN